MTKNAGDRRRVGGPVLLPPHLRRGGLRGGDHREQPAQGLELASGSRFDVILCDWRMPELDGLDVVEMLDKRAPDAAVVMITGFPFRGHGPPR